MKCDDELADRRKDIFRKRGMSMFAAQIAQPLFTFHFALFTFQASHHKSFYLIALANSHELVVETRFWNPVDMPHASTVHSLAQTNGLRRLAPTRRSLD